MPLNYDGIYSELFRNRIVLVADPVDDGIAQAVISQLTALQTSDPERDVQLYLNSPGGFIPSCLAIYDTMMFVTNDINTVCIGRCNAVTTLLLAAGQTRCALPHSFLFFGKPEEGESVGFGGVKTVVSEKQKESSASLGGRPWERKVGHRLKDIVSELLLKHTGGKVKSRNFFWENHMLTSEEAVKYGFVDTIIRFHSKKDRAIRAAAAAS